MTVQITPITQSTDTFGQWLDKTNQLITAVNNYVVSVNSNTAVGNADISGKLSAIQFVANSNGGFYAGIGSANATLDTNSLLFRASLTSNLIITTSGMLINDNTLYSGSVMTMGNTVIHSANITVDNLYLSTFANVGNTFLTRSSIYTDMVNTEIFYASANGTFGDNEANTYIDRYGVIVYSQPTGSYVVNTVITSTSVSSVDLLANTVHVDNISSRTPGIPFRFKGNLEFQGANNYFDLGLNSNGDINIINGARLHVVTSDPISAQPPNSNTSILLDSNNNKLIQFRNSADSGQYSGLVFSDSKQGGYVVYNSPGGSSGANSDWMSLGSYNGFKFGIGHEDARDGIAFKGQIATTIDTHGIEIRSQNGSPNLRMRDSSAGVLAFYDPVDTTSSGTYNYNITMADGKIDFNFSRTNSPYDTGDTQMILYNTGDLTVYNSLGVGTDASGNDGEITANTIILTGTATIAKGLNVTGNTGINGSAFVNFDITAGGTIAAGNQIRAAQDIIAFTSSDITLKTNIVNIPDALNKVSQINGVEFDWTDEHIVKYGGIDNYFNRKHDVGVIAQEVEAVLPEVVATRSDGTKAVKYDRLVALLIEAVKELKAEVDKLKNVSTK